MPRPIPLVLGGKPKRRRRLPATDLPKRACRVCGSEPLPRWRLCRLCWDRRWVSEPDELPTLKEGVRFRFGELSGGQTYFAIAGTAA